MLEFSIIILIFAKLFNPCPDPIGEPKGITVAQPISSKCNASIGSAFMYGNTVNPFFTKNSAAFSVPIGSGNKYLGSEITSNLTKKLSFCPILQASS